jgi:hypothetical protein
MRVPSAVTAARTASNGDLLATEFPFGHSYQRANAHVGRRSPWGKRNVEQCAFESIANEVAKNETVEGRESTNRGWPEIGD